ncbi:hypothetical protein AB2C70_34130, partial [Pseudomonas aeruginosa]
MTSRYFCYGPVSARKSRESSIENFAALTGILFVLLACLHWEMSPAGMDCGCGCGCGMSFSRRLRDCQTAGVWTKAYQVRPK